MFTINSRVTRLSLTILPFLIILISIVTVESICHFFLHAGLYPFAQKHYLIVELTTAFLATLFLASLFLRNQKLTEKVNAIELKKVNEEWEKTLNTMTDFVSVHDKNFKVVKANQALCDFLDKNSEEVIGQYCYQLFHDLDEPIDNCPHRQSFTKGHSVTEIIDDPIIGVPLQVTCSPLYCEDDKFSGAVHIARVYVPIEGREKLEANIIPICAACKNIRGNDEQWMAPEAYFAQKYNSMFTHTVCTHCQEKLYPEFFQSK